MCEFRSRDSPGQTKEGGGIRCATTLVRRKSTTRHGWAVVGLFGAPSPIRKKNTKTGNAALTLVRSAVVKTDDQVDSISQALAHKPKNFDYRNMR